GDTILEDQPMVEVMTDKATVEIPAPKAGRVAKISAPEGKMCAVGQVMVVIETDGAPPSPTVATPTLAEEERQFGGKLPTDTASPTVSRGGAAAADDAAATNGGKVLATPA